MEKFAKRRCIQTSRSECIRYGTSETVVAEYRGITVRRFSIFEFSDLQILEYVEGISRSEENKNFLIKETTLKTKVFDKLIYSKPLNTAGQEGADLREREQKNIIRMLNSFINEAWEPK